MSVNTTDQQQAAVLLDFKLRPMLQLLMHAPKSSSEVAQALNLSLSKAHYQLQKLQKLGVARIVSTEQRAGRPVKRYAVATEWFIPFELTTSETPQQFGQHQMMPRLEKVIERFFQTVRDEHHDLGYWVDSNSIVLGTRSGPLTPQVSGSALLMLGGLELSPSDTIELKHRLLDLLQEFQGHSKGQGPSCTIGLMLVPDGNLV